MLQHILILPFLQSKLNRNKILEDEKWFQSEHHATLNVLNIIDKFRAHISNKKLSKKGINYTKSYNQVISHQKKHEAQNENENLNANANANANANLNLNDKMPRKEIQNQNNNPKLPNKNNESKTNFIRKNIDFVSKKSKK